MSSFNRYVELPRPSGENPAEPEARGPQRPRWALAPIAGIILLSAGFGAAAGAGVATLADNGSNTTTVVSQPAATTASTASGPITSAPASSSQGVADLYSALRPSVVKITATSNGPGGGGTGSGLVLDTQGHIVTNYHVINGASHLDVRLSDGNVATATVVGADPGDDLAVLKIDTSGLKLVPVKIGNSDNLQIGDTVIAIGNPLDLEATLTEGIVSGKGRVLSSGTNSRPQSDLIQTDTAINPGNSGGGLFNLAGELVGITNAIENPSGQESFAGIGYAIPVNTLQAHLDQLIKGGTISHARLGVALEDLTPAVAAQLGINAQQGVVVMQVQPGSGAAKAGLRAATNSGAGDVIIAIDGHEVKTFQDLAGYIDTKQGGDTVKLDVLRDGQKTTLNVTLDTWGQ